jgi:hypothetical protein
MDYGLRFYLFRLVSPFPHFTLGAERGSIRVRYSIKFKKRPYSGAGHSWTREETDRFINIRATILEKVELLSSDNNNDSSYSVSDFSSNNRDSSKAE